MLRNCKYVLAGALVASSFATQAADFYAGGSVGISRYKDASNFADSGITVHVDDKTDTSFKLFGGAELDKNFAVEAGYVDLGKLKATGAGFGVTVPVTLKVTGAFIDAVGLLPVSPGVTLFGKLGLFTSKAKARGSVFGISLDDSDSSTNAKLGLGASFEVTKGLAIRTEWERFRFKSGSEKSDTDLVSVGVSYKF
jgi:OmpA-OmpF porin, OOP family